MFREGGDKWWKCNTTATVILRRKEVKNWRIRILSGVSGMTERRNKERKSIVIVPMKGSHHSPLPKLVVSLLIQFVPPSAVLTPSPQVRRPLSCQNQDSSPIP